jgi:hypothetical protein
MCACFPATRSTHPRSKWQPGTPSRAHAGKAPPRLPCPGVLAAARRSQATRAVRSHTGGPDLNGRIPLGLVHGGPVSRAHGAVHRRRGRWINDPRLNRAAFFKSPWTFLLLHAGPSTYRNLRKQVLIFMFWPLYLLDSLTRGPFPFFLHVSPSIFIKLCFSPWFSS